MVKYGIPTNDAVILFELGFVDRNIALELSYLFSNSTENSILDFLKKNAEVKVLLSKYPSYFNMVLNKIIEK